MAKNIINNATFLYGVAKWIVDPVKGSGTHTTIQAAINSSSDGDTIVVRPGTYVEDITHKPGVNVTAFIGDADFENVNVVGQWTISGAGLFGISGLSLTTNANYCISMTGGSATILHVEQCLINATNHTAINYSTSNAGSVLAVFDSVIGLVSGTAMHTMSSTGNLNYYQNQIVGPSITASNNSSGSVALYACQMGCPISTSGTGTLALSNCLCSTQSQNVTAIITSGTGFVNFFDGEIHTGTASAVSIGSGTNAYIADAVISSNNTNVLTGSGTLNYGFITFTGTSSGHNVSTENVLPTLPSVSGSSVTFDGDSGSAATSAGVITFNATTNSGSSVSFSGTGSTLSLNFTDANNNTLVGLNAGSATAVNGGTNTGFGNDCLSSLNGSGSTGNANTCFGYATGNALVVGVGNTIMGQLAFPIGTGSANTGIGDSVFLSLLSGGHNIGLGSGAGGNYSSSESSNIVIGAPGTSGESNVIRIGIQGSGLGAQNKCFIAGIEGVSVSNKNYVTINTSTGQLGSETSASLFSLNSQVFTTTGTYTPTSGMVQCVIECWGGGGGGGGAAATSVNFNAAGGGGAGSYSRKISTASAIGASQTVTIGAAGAAGASGNNVGGNGGDTSVGAICIGKGGTGGNGTSGTNNAGGGAGGIAGTGDVTGTGMSGFGSLSTATFTDVTAYGGTGGSSSLGSGGGGSITPDTGGGAATGFGSGGGGAQSQTSNQAGGAGTAGYVVITEYIIS